ncbi:MAG: glycosyltransferase family 39 protein [Candidatus Hydrogenedentes bacterium]|nr:glycosyltransferase family 39 protein [Candidatus Hydrogenedentota bacterium]
MSNETNTDDSPGVSLHPAPLLERCVVSLAVASVFVLAFANLAGPSLWHDELIHVYVGKKILETGLPLLLSGRVFTNGMLFNYLLAGLIAIFGDGEAAVRSISAVFAVVNVYLTYRMLRPLIGGPSAALTALLMAWSPWQLAWARQARFYMLHQTVYLVTMLLVWRFGEADRTKLSRWGAGFAAAYCIGLLAGPQTVFFLGPIGAYAACRWLGVRTLRSRWTVLIAICGLLGAATLLGYYLTLPKAEHDAIFKEALRADTPDDGLVDHDQSDSLYYFRFYTNNLGSGFFVLACAGFALLVARAGKPGLFIALAFVVPILLLNFGITQHRRYRFLFFAYPFYVAACAYALVYLTQFVRTSRQSAWRMAAAVAIVAFTARLTVSQYRLAADCIEVAGGASTTLAVHHPQWRQPCTYVKEHRGDAAIVCTTYIAALHYVGHIDTWYPSRVIVWEYIESGMDGMRTLDELKAFVSEHPRGYFIAEHRRFHMWPFFKDDLEWVERNMKKIDEASNGDISLYEWGSEEAT